jgi:hypothetical protein
MLGCGCLLSCIQASGSVIQLSEFQWKCAIFMTLLQKQSFDLPMFPYHTVLLLAVTSITVHHSQLESAMSSKKTAMQEIKQE